MIWRLVAAAALVTATGGAPALAAGGGHDEPQKAAPGKRKPTDADSYVGVDALAVSILVNGRPRGLLLVELCLDVPDAELRASAEAQIPRLMDAYNGALGRYGATTAHPNRAPDAGGVAALLQAETDRVLGKAGAQVLLANLMVRAR